MDYKTSEERAEMTSLLNRRDELVGEKKQHESALMTIKNQVRGRVLPAKQYRQCCDGQQKRLQQIQYVESELRAIKVRIRELSDIETQRFMEARKEDRKQESAKAPEGDRFLDLLFYVSEIRDEYRRFSADATRVSSMRRTAAEFANKLDELIGRFQST